MKPAGTAYLYKITRCSSGQSYIGVSINPDVRWWTHRWIASRSKCYLHRAIAKHGVTSFSFEIIACARNWKDASLVEVILISQHRSHVSVGGYNMTLGGEGPFGRTHSPTTRKKISNSRKGHGHPIPPKQREVHRQRTKAMYEQHPEYRTLLAQRSLESRIRNGNDTGRRNSPETIERMRQSALKRWSSISTEERSTHMKPAITKSAAARKKQQ